MQNTSKIFRLKGTIQHYDWGGIRFLSELLKLPSPDKKPCAEYWLGAHSKSPALVILNDGTTKSLDQLISDEPAFWLGEKVYKQFGSLPYLLKVQDVKDMLSIQVHPSKQAAVIKFEEEDRKGIPLTAPDRNYKDKNHKPELLSPVGEFYLLHGFKAETALSRILKEVPELNFLQDDFQLSGYQSLYTTVMTMPQESVNKRLQPLLDRIIPLYEAGKLTRDQEDFWAARAAITFNRNGNIDRGIFSIYLFNVVKMFPGQALFQGAGLPHAYLEGHTIEIMANSDNVLRGGLTPKHIDVKELLQHIHFTPTVPDVIEGENKGGPERSYPTSAGDFQLSRIVLEDQQEICVPTATADIYFIYDGAVSAFDESQTKQLSATGTIEDQQSRSSIGRSSGQDTLELSTGEAMLAIPGSSVRFKAGGNTVIFRATVPE